jgi:hypothetical protein
MSITLRERENKSIPDNEIFFISGRNHLLEVWEGEEETFPQFFLALTTASRPRPTAKFLAFPSGLATKRAAVTRNLMQAPE